jgi:hypothetical protein
MPVPVHDTLRFATPPAEVIGLGLVVSVGALQLGAATGAVPQVTFATALPLSPFAPVAMMRYVQFAGPGLVMMLYGPCEGVTQPASPLTDHWYAAIAALAGHCIAMTIACPGSAAGDETKAEQAMVSQVSV